MKYSYKKYRLLFAFVALILGGLVSCDDSDRYDEFEDGYNPLGPVAGFTYEIEGRDVAFTNTSTNATNFGWNFEGDNVDEFEAVATDTIYTFDETINPAIVTLSAINTNTGLTNRFEMEIGFLEPSFIVASTTDKTVTFENTSVGGASYSCDFGDGVGTSTEENPSYEYTDFGTYTTTLTATDSFGNVEIFENNEIIIALPGAGTFEAVIQNGDFQTYPTGTIDTDDLVDAWTINSDNTFSDGSTNGLFNFWENTDLEAWVSDEANNGGIGTTDKASSSGTNAQSAGGTSDFSYKMDSAGERAYQPFQIETGVEYTITAFLKSESTPVGVEEGTFHILSGIPSADTDVEALSIASVPVISEEINGWRQVTFSFTAAESFSFSQEAVDSSADDILTSIEQQFAIFYFIPTNTVTSDNEVFLTDIVITTFGF